MQNTTSHLLKTGNHRLAIDESRRCSCFLCNRVGTLEEIGTCDAPDSERTEFDARYTPAEEKPNYRKHSLEAKLDSLLPQFPSYDVIAHELWRDTEGGWSCDPYQVGGTCVCAF